MDPNCVMPLDRAINLFHEFKELYKSGDIVGISDSYIQLSPAKFSCVFGKKEWTLERGGGTVHASCDHDGIKFVAVFS